MTLDHLNKQLNEIRAEASTLKSRFLDQVARIDNDDRASMLYKREQVADLARDTKPKLRALFEREVAAIERERKTLTQKVAGSAGTGGADVISFRDAHDRARTLTTATEARDALTRAMDLDDTVLAHAILDHALRMGFTPAIDAYIAQHPGTEATIRDLSNVHAWQQNFTTQFETELEYQLPQARIRELFEGHAGNSQAW